MKMYEIKYKLMVLGGSLLLGLCAGAIFALLSNTAISKDAYNVRQLTEKLEYSTAHVGRLQCEVLQDKAALYSKPSGLEGRITDYMSKGVKVDYLETVSSMDTNADYAITNTEMSFRKLFGRRHIIPAGTKVQILRGVDSSGEIKGRVHVDGKDYEKSFEVQYLQMPYVGQWKKVEFNGKPGYMHFNALSEGKLM